ncbi:Hit zinc finger and papa-1-like domain-containing protein [Thalictrum thalictroides]|uniref:Hit zinc finger and papa-1-like domain-containing protein n=1 Tax=Thalictrum thalictroides TaxID=46969 RepID=A0A7J6XG36_THATH|nr:Hit zinc finger and papa-1-like domain-containing protein [Thalictrum thalictroides]
MEGFVGSLIKAGDSTVKKKRSKISRGPRSESFPVSRGVLSLSSAPLSNIVSKRFNDENTDCDTISHQEEYNQNQCAVKFPSANRETTEAACKSIRHDDKGSEKPNGINGNDGLKNIDDWGKREGNSKCGNEGIFRTDVFKAGGNFEMLSRKGETCMDIGKTSENRSMGNLNGLGNQNNIRKVKLKMGGITRTLHTNSSSDGSAGGPKPSFPSYVPQTLQDAPDKNHTSKPVDGLKGVPWKDFSEGNFGLRNEDSSKDKMPRHGVSGNKADKSEPVRKSRRVPKRRVLDGDFGEEDEDDEIRYLEKLRSLKITADSGAKHEDAEEGTMHLGNVSRVPKKKRVDHEYVEDLGVSSTSGRKNNKSRLERGSENTYYVEEEEEPTSDGVPDAKSKAQKESVDSSGEARKEMSLTRRQRALQSGKDTSTSLIEFPNGLPPAPSRKQKEKLSEVEQQLKKAEAAQRRRMQMEKAARESEAEAIRKILGQDSSRKKKEDKLKKRRDELAEEKAENARTLPPNTVRWISGPSGTTVTFSEDVGLPSIFKSKPCSYPPPREKCAGPSCSKPYVYRDSKSKLPLCSLECYKAVNGQSNPAT